MSTNPPKDPVNIPVISDETILKVAKEIVIKFIEIGRITPATFPENFTEIYRTIATTVGSKA